MLLGLPNHPHSLRKAKRGALHKERSDAGYIWKVLRFPDSGVTRRVSLRPFRRLHPGYEPTESGHVAFEALANAMASLQASYLTWLNSLKFRRPSSEVDSKA